LVKRTKDPIVDGVPPVDFYVSRRIGFDELLPWEVVDSLIPRSLLEREAMRAHHGEDWTQPKSADEQDREQQAEAFERERAPVVNDVSSEVRV
jgi:hypothetical protein